MVVTDGVTQATFVMYLYGELGWDSSDYVRRAMIGHYSTHRNKKLIFQHAHSNTGNGFRMHELAGNRGKKKTGWWNIWCPIFMSLCSLQVAPLSNVSFPRTPILCQSLLVMRRMLAPNSHLLQVSEKKEIVNANFHSNM